MGARPMAPASSRPSQARLALRAAKAQMTAEAYRAKLSRVPASTASALPPGSSAARPMAIPLAAA